MMGAVMDGQIVLEQARAVCVVHFCRDQVDLVLLVPA